jgi:hypothetical protein
MTRLKQPAIRPICRDSWRGILRNRCLWVDIRGEGVGQLVLLAGKSGPTIARDVRVTFDPAIAVRQPDRQPIFDTLERGIASIPPGRTMRWVFGDVPRESIGLRTISIAYESKPRDRLAHSIPSST